tara:strand:+ start:89 stop:253 length:165 start_codon:yes stop_codon:yes gene_type:complete
MVKLREENKFQIPKTKKENCKGDKIPNSKKEKKIPKEIKFQIPNLGHGSSHVEV